jgi:iron complex outermembrane recepter protein
MNNRRRRVATRRTPPGASAAPPPPRREFPTSPLAAAIVVALYPASAALAQRAGSDRSGRLEEIIVTATRRELNLQEVGQSITAFSTADIERQALQDVEDVIGALTSVNLVNLQPGRNSIFMRGISTGSAEYYTDSQVSIYLDDQPLTSVSQQVDIRPIDIDRIESLPGPQGTLFGSSSQSGTLRYITNKPDVGGWSSQVDLEVGTIKGGEETYDVSGHLNIPVSDNVAIRAVGFYAQDGGWVDNVLGETFMGDQDNADVVEDDFNEFETYGGRIAARWMINPQWETTLSLISQWSRADGSWDSDPALGDYKIARFFKEWREDEWYQTSLNIKGDLGFAELSITGSYFDRNIDYEWDDATYDQWRAGHTREDLVAVHYPPTAEYPNLPAYYTWAAIYDTTTATGALIGQTYNWQKQNRETYEVRLTSKGESRFQWMAGLFYEDVYDWWDYGTELPGLQTTRAWAYAQYYAYNAKLAGYDVQYPIPPTDIYYQEIFDKSVKQKAVFGELTYELTEKWSVTGGARWFEFDRHEVDTSYVPSGMPVWDPDAGPIDPDDGEPTGAFVGGRIESSGTDSDTVFKFATQYKFDDDRMVYLLYSEGFRLGGKNAARAAATDLLPLEYKPDTLENYEAGLKSTWFEDRVQLNASAFYMKWTDFQINSDGPGDAPWWVRGIFNGNDAEQKGVEITGLWNVTANFVLEGSATLADPEFTETTVLPDETVIEPGTSLPLSPERKYWVSAEYTIPNFLAWDGELFARWSYNYQSETWKDIDAAVARDPEQRIPSWSTSNLQFGFSHNSGWDAALIIRNLFDEKGINWLSSVDYGEFFGNPTNRYVRTLQQPRTVSLSFTKKW